MRRKEKDRVHNPYILLLESPLVTGGRPKKTLTDDGWKLVTTLSQFMATDEEIAAALSGDSGKDEDKISVDILTNDYNKERFAECKLRGKSKGKTSLRSWQWQSAKDGNTAMQIFLGKNYLGQSDRAEIEVPETSININITPATADDMMED